MPYFDYDDPMSYGNDLPSQGGITGTMNDGSSNLLRLIRLHNIFNPGATTGVDTGIGRTPDMLPVNMARSQPGGNAPIDPVGKDSVDSSNIGMNVMDLYHPSTKYEDQMDALLKQMPVRNKPGIGRKIMASIAGLGGVGSADKILYAPYYNQLADWKNQFEPVEKAAADETRDNANLRQIAIAAVNERHRDQMYENLLRHQGVTENQGQQKIDLSGEKFDYKKEHDKVVDEIRRQTALGGVFKIDADGTPRIYHRDGSSVPVDGRYLSADEINMYATKKASAVAGAAAAARAANERHRIVKGTIQDENDPTKTIEGTWDMDAEGGPAFTPGKTTEGKPTISPPKSATEKQPNAALLSKQEAIAAQNYIKDHPEARNWITFDKKTGAVTKVTKPGENWVMSNPSEQQYKEMQTAIYGHGNPNFVPEEQAKRKINPNTAPNVPQNTAPNQAPNPNAEVPSAEKPPHPGMKRARNKNNPKRLAWVDPTQSAVWSGEWEIIK